MTIIIAVLNGGRTLKRCLESVVAQKKVTPEIIVMDGGSTDESLSVIKEFDPVLAYWESRPDRGIYHAWNKAVSRAAGDWICFLGSDDWFIHERVLADFSPYLENAEREQIRVVYGRMARVDRNGGIVKWIGEPWEKVGWLMKHGMSIPHPGTMHHMSLFRENGEFDETFRIAGDYEFLLRELKTGRALFADIPTVYNQMGGIADEKALLTHQEVDRARKQNGLNNVSIIWWAVHVRSFFRRWFKK